MAKPWEATPTTGPWESPPDQIEETANVQHPDVSFGLRAFVQNFANSPQAAAEYLKTKGFESRIVDSEVEVKKPGEAGWKKLQPKGFDAQDITDNAYNIGSGIASGLTGAAAAVGAAPFSGGVGSIPAAMAAGGATSAAAEGLRQKAGQMMGIPQEVSGTDVAVQGAAGAAGPLLFGTGASGAKLAASGISKELLPKIADSQRGLVSRGASYIGQEVLPKIGEFTSGVPKKAIQTLANRGDELSALKQEGAYNDLVDATHSQAKEGLWQAKVKVGKELENLIDDTGGEVNLVQARDTIDNHIASLQQGELRDNPLVQEQIAALRQARNSIFKESKDVVTEPGMPLLKKEMEGMTAFDKKQLLDDLSNSEGIVPEQIFGASERRLVDVPDNVSPKKAFELQHLLSDYADLSKTKEGPMSRLTGTPAERQWANANASAYKALNDQLSEITEGQSGQLKNLYSKYSKLQKNLQTHMSTPERTGQTLKNLNNPNKEYLRGSLDDLKYLTEGAVDIQPSADLLQAHKYFANPTVTPLSGEGSTSTSRTVSLGALGGLLGYKVGGYPGAAIGAATGNLVGSPAAVQAYTRGIVGANRMMTPARPAANAAAQSVWNTLYNNSNKGNGRK